MPLPDKDHFARAIADLAAHGDNDMLPFDVDTRFIADKAADLCALGVDLATALARKTPKDAVDTLQRSRVFHERLLAPVGHSGFRITTKIEPFWNIYLNAISIALADLHEPQRSDRAHSYRLASPGGSLFDSQRSWRAFRQATLEELSKHPKTAVVIQTDVSGFYEHVYHHRLENFVRDLLPSDSNIPSQIDQLLKKLAYGRSFGLPVGGQAARILAEIMMSSVDRTLTTKGMSWHRFVDDFVIVAGDHTQAYQCLSTLAHALADVGLSLNRSKTTILSSANYRDLVQNQLTASDAEGRRLLEIDLHFDPYSDNPDEEYTPSGAL